MPIDDRITRLGGNHHDKLFIDTYENAKAKPVKPGEKQITKLTYAWEAVKVKLRRIWYDSSYGWVNNKKQLSELNKSMRLIVTNAKTESSKEKLTLHELYSDVNVLKTAVSQAKEIITVLKGANANKKELGNADMNLKDLEEALGDFEKKKKTAETVIRSQRLNEAKEARTKQAEKRKLTERHEQPKIESAKLEREHEVKRETSQLEQTQLESIDLEQTQNLTIDSQKLVPPEVTSSMPQQKQTDVHQKSREMLKDALENYPKMSPINFVSFDVKVSPYRKIFNAVYEEVVEFIKKNPKVEDKENYQNTYSNFQFQMQIFLENTEDRRAWSRLVKELKLKIDPKKDIQDYSDVQLRVLLGCMNICRQDWREIYKKPKT